MRLATGVAGAATAGFSGGAALCHGVHGHGDAPHGHGHGDVEARMAELAARLARLEAETAARYGVSATTGQGDAVFAWDERLTAALPASCRPFEQHMHGGFNEDAETGVVYTGIPGAGLFAISPDLATWTRLGTDERLAANIHGLVAFEHGGRKQLALAQNDAQRVLVVDAQTGAVLQELHAPRGGEFGGAGAAAANAYYSARRGDGGPKVFAVTDVTYCPENGRLYCVTGYCDGDFVLSASMGDDDGRWAWGPVAWGGKGDGAGQFRTAHGVTCHNGHVYVANREAFQVVKFAPDGALVEVLPGVPHGSRICNVAVAKGSGADAAARAATPGGGEGYLYMNALAPLGDGTTYALGGGREAVRGAARTAPIYAHSGEAVVSVIDAGSLGIPVLKHLHHVWPHYVPNADGSKTLHLLVHGWRDGKFAVLRHEKEE